MALRHGMHPDRGGELQGQGPRQAVELGFGRGVGSPRGWPTMPMERLSVGMGWVGMGQIGMGCSGKIGI